LATRNVQTEQFRATKKAYLRVDGAGIKGTYTIKGSVAVRDEGTLYITAKGSTAVTKLATMNNDDINFWAKAKFIRNGVTVRQKHLKQKDKPMVLDAHWYHIGSTILPTIRSGSCGKETVIIEGGYEYITAAGMVVPQPLSSTSASVEIVRW